LTDIHHQGFAGERAEAALTGHIQAVAALAIPKIETRSSRALTAMPMMPGHCTQIIHSGVATIVEAAPDHRPDRRLHARWRRRAGAAAGNVRPAAISW
jgi:hypothetical protein